MVSSTYRISVGISLHSEGLSQVLQHIVMAVRALVKRFYHGWIGRSIPTVAFISIKVIG